jgi:C4-dicarboxylate transporter DctQ subunit
LRLGWINRLEEGLIAFLLTLMTLISFTQVVARYVFNYSFVWALELVTFLFGGLIFLGISYGVRVGSHIGVDALVRGLPPAKARAVALVATVLCMVYAAIVFTGGWIYVGKMIELGIEAQDIPVPEWVPRVVLPLGAALLFLRFGQVLYGIVTGKDAHLLGDEVKDALKHKADDDASPPGRT